MIEIARILCPVDFCGASERALEYATATARWYGSRLDVLHVQPELPVVDMIPSLVASPATQVMAAHTIEAISGRVAGTISHRDELWDRCYEELMANARVRLAEEIDRLGGDYAHVNEESIHTRHDDAAGEAWLHGRFSYMLYRRPSPSR